jgi:2,4-dienoyl-CoA reductase-like NADH-dependent reductase (Old Yellow Enzyme family)
MSLLFSPITLRDVTCRNRVWVSPMCQYCSDEGLPTDWHLVHLGSRAVGGAGLVMVEASAVSPEGRISPDDSGIWSARHAQAFQRIAAFIAAQGAVPAIQIAHAGRKASTDAPWRGGRPLGREARGWQPVGASPIPFDAGHPAPTELSAPELGALAERFAQAARHAYAAGFQVLEIHAAHGYLLHSFLSPLTNRRTDAYGGELAARMRFPLEVVRAVRAAWPASLPLLVRISATDWIEGGWDLEQSTVFAHELKAAGVDLVDCSSGALSPAQRIALGPGYQVPFAAAIRAQAGIPTGAVGLITEPAQAEQILVTGQADAVLLARAMLRDPYWALHAARALGATVDYAPVQYLRALG